MSQRTDESHEDFLKRVQQERAAKRGVPQILFAYQQKLLYRVEIFGDSSAVFQWCEENRVLFLDAPEKLQHKTTFWFDAVDGAKVRDFLSRCGEAGSEPLTHVQGGGGTHITSGDGAKLKGLGRKGPGSRSKK